jgi:hypothetical protein
MGKYSSDGYCSYGEGAEEAKKVLEKIYVGFLVRGHRESQAEYAMDLAERIADIRGEAYVAVHQHEKGELRSIDGFDVYAFKPHIHKGDGFRAMRVCGGGLVVEAQGVDKKLFHLEDLVEKECYSDYEDGIKRLISIYRLHRWRGEEHGRRPKEGS